MEIGNFSRRLFKRSQKLWKVFVFILIIGILLTSAFWVVAKELGVTIDPKEGPIAYAPSIKVEGHEIEAYPLNALSQKYSNFEYESVKPEFRYRRPSMIQISIGYRDSLANKTALLDFKQNLDEKASRVAEEKRNQEIEVFITFKKPLEDEAFISFLEKYEITLKGAMARGYGNYGPGEDRGINTAYYPFDSQIYPRLADIRQFVTHLHSSIEGDRKYNEQYAGAINIYANISIDLEKIESLLDDERVFVVDVTPELVKNHLRNQLKKHPETNDIEIQFFLTDLFNVLERTFYREELEKQKIVL